MMKFIKINILPYVVYAIYKVYMGLVRFIEPEYPVKLKGKKANFIVAHFHQDELALVHQRTNSNFCTMTSTSTDGEMMTRFLKLMGYRSVRGSSTRGGATALLQMIKQCSAQKLNPVIAVDGPRGPIYKVKNGVIELAKQTGFPILPVALNYSSAFCIQKSWNKALIPKPFSKVTIRFGEPIHVPNNADRAKIEGIKNLLEKELLSLKGL
jgi:lysophospholipid acyltransferase (LPLAT)-like uncharacterized protein